MAAPGTTATEWLRRWDAQQQGHIPDREERFAAITEALAAQAGERPRVLDLGSGPGSLSARVLQRLPESQVVAVDTDPVLLRIGREALAGDRVHFVDADLRGDWEATLPAGPPFDAAVSTTALHWLKLAELLPFYRRLASVLRPGGLFLDGDRFDFNHDQQQI
ncbi:MAG: class I SAM-dependent methyltransferase, partial [Candidatus Dormibacteria bacterium]